MSKATCRLWWGHGSPSPQNFFNIEFEFEVKFSKNIIPESPPTIKFTQRDPKK